MVSLETYLVDSHVAYASLRFYMGNRVTEGMIIYHLISSTS